MTSSEDHDSGDSPLLTHKPPLTVSTTHRAGGEDCSQAKLDCSLASQAPCQPGLQMGCLQSALALKAALLSLSPSAETGWQRRERIKHCAESGYPERQEEKNRDRNKA